MEKRYGLTIKTQHYRFHLWNSLLRWTSGYIFNNHSHEVEEFPDGSVDKESTYHAGNVGEVGSMPGSGRFPGGGNSNPLQYSCLKNPMDRRAWQLQSTVKESDTLRGLHTHTHTHTYTHWSWSTSSRNWKIVDHTTLCDPEGNGNPLQYSCLENPRNEGAWWASIYGVTQSRARLKWLSCSLVPIRGCKSPSPLRGHSSGYQRMESTRNYNQATGFLFPSSSEWPILQNFVTLFSVVGPSLSVILQVGHDIWVWSSPPGISAIDSRALGSMCRAFYLLMPVWVFLASLDKASCSLDSNFDLRIRCLKL